MRRSSTGSVTSCTYPRSSCRWISPAMKAESAVEAGYGRARRGGSRHVHGIFTPWAIVSSTQALAPSARHSVRERRKRWAGRCPTGSFVSRGAKEGVALGDGGRDRGGGATGGAAGTSVGGGGACDDDPRSGMVAAGGLFGPSPSPRTITRAATSAPPRGRGRRRPQVQEARVGRRRC